MKQLCLLGFVSLFLITACDSGIVDSTESQKDSLEKGKTDKVLVCHVDAETGDVHLLSVSGNANHVGNPSHSFGDVEDYYPDPNLAAAPGARSDIDPENGIADGCEKQTIWAVAYTDMEDNGDSYDPYKDVLIAKLVDFNQSGAIDVGDRVYLGRYPEGFSTSDGFGLYRNTEYLVNSVGQTESWRIQVNGPGGELFSFLSLVGEAEEFADIGRESGSGIVDNWGSDFISGDQIFLFSGSPGAPSSDISLSRINTEDDPFIDVQINLPD